MSRPSRLDGQEETVRAELVAGRTWEEIAERSGVAVTTLKSWAKRQGLRKPKVGTLSIQRLMKEHNIPVGHEISREELLEAELTELKRDAKKARKTTVAQERILQAIEHAVVAVTPSLRAPVRFDTIHRGEGGTLPAPPKHRQAALLSDWHAGEVVDPAQVGGLNRFDWSVLEERVEEVIKSILSFRAVRPALTGLDLWWLGDMISGDIHEELMVTNQFPAAECSVKVGYLMGHVVEALASYYPEIYCIGVPGNHARTKKQHVSKDVHDSWDWTAYHIAKAHTRGLTNVTWEIPNAGTTIREIAGHRILICHGDGIRSSMPGIPEGGIQRRYNALLQQYASAGVKIDGMAYGHFHQSGVRKKRTFGNGSLIGLTEHGYKNYGDGEEPTQLLLTWNEAKSRLTDVSYITPTAGVRS